MKIIKFITYNSYFRAIIYLYNGKRFRIHDIIQRQNKKELEKEVKDIYGFKDIKYEYLY